MPLNISWQFAANDGGVDVVRDPSSSHFSGAPLLLTLFAKRYRTRSMLAKKA